jgi:hypothetical protein
MGNFYSDRICLLIRAKRSLYNRSNEQARETRQGTDATVTDILLLTLHCNIQALTHVSRNGVNHGTVRQQQRYIHARGERATDHDRRVGNIVG